MMDIFDPKRISLYLSGGHLTVTPLLPNSTIL